MPDLPPASSCVVLVPVGGGGLDPGCDAALRELERRGHPVRRAYGCSQLDAARNQMASDALAAGFDELLWVDPDVAFDPDDVGRLRAHGLPLVCGLYPEAGSRRLACEFPPGTPRVRLGPRGELVEVRYAGLGFAHTRAALYRLIHHRLGLPACDRRRGAPPTPFFTPAVVDDPAGPRSVGGDYAFCDRARRCGVPVLADTAIRLGQAGACQDGREDAGLTPDRAGGYVFRPPGAGRPAPPPGEPPPAGGYTADWFTHNLPVLERVLAPLVGREAHALEIGVFEGRSTVWLMDRVLTHPGATLTWVDTFGGSAEHTGLDLTGLEARFRANTARFGARVSGHVGRSRDVLRAMAGERFDLVYVDGSHDAADVLADAVLAWPLLRPGGLMGFDDYAWGAYSEPERCPALAVDAFLACHRGAYEEVHRGYQVWVRKRR